MSAYHYTYDMGDYRITLVGGDAPVNVEDVQLTAGLLARGWNQRNAARTCPHSWGEWFPLTISGGTDRLCERCGTSERRWNFQQREEAMP